MKIIYLKIENYRNLSGLEIHLNPRNNFIVGENNLGKSNFLQLLSTMFTRKSFKRDDFTEITNPIEVAFTLELEEVEIGLFDDLFDPTDASRINIKAIQNTIDDPIDFWHVESNARVPASMVKLLNFLYYDSVRNPSSELSFNKNKGVGKFLHHIIIKHLETSGETDGDFVDEGMTDNLVGFVNSVICKVKAFSQYSITAEVERDVENLLSRILILKDGNDKYIHQSGYGVQFLAIITLAILQKILETIELKRDRGIFEYNEPEGDDEVKKAISLIIGFDEPEIHLHPYLQRSLVKYINKILTNQEEDFSELLQSIFGLNKLIGQSIIATHSPSIILNDYTEIVRFYKKEGTLAVKSGIKANLHHGLKKQLAMQFPFIKEAFFARSVVIVEGESEIGALPLFALAMGDFDFDEYGIAIIKAGGKQSIEPLIKLLDEFEIPCIGLKDRDKDPLTTNPKIIQTCQRDFDVEIVNLIDNGKEHSLLLILNNYDSRGINRVLSEEALDKVKNKYNSYIEQTLVTIGGVKLADIDADDIEMKRLWYLTWLGINKGIILGQVIGNSLDNDDIPIVFRSLIKLSILSANT